MQTIFNYTVGQGARMATAYGKELGLGRDATAGEIKQEMWNAARAVCAKWEMATSDAAALATSRAALTDLGVVT